MGKHKNEPAPVAKREEAEEEAEEEEDQGSTSYYSSYYSESSSESDGNAHHSTNSGVDSDSGEGLEQQTEKSEEGPPQPRHRRPPHQGKAKEGEGKDEKARAKEEAKAKPVGARASGGGLQLPDLWTAAPTQPAFRAPTKHLPNRINIQHATFPPDLRAELTKNFRLDTNGWLRKGQITREMGALRTHCRRLQQYLAACVFVCSGLLVHFLACHTPAPRLVDALATCLSHVAPSFFFLPVLVGAYLASDRVLNRER